MKKKRLIAITVLLVFLISTSFAFSKSISQNITAWFYDIKVNVDGKALAFSSKPFIYNGHTYVSMNDVANNLGYSIQWDNKNKIMDLTANANNSAALNTLKYDLDRKNLELNNLKYQLQQKELELAILKEQKSSSSSSRSSSSRKTEDLLNDLEDIFEDDYYRYRDSDVTMRLTYSLNQQSNDNIRVRMYTDFYKSSSTWRNRDKEDFRDFILDICEEIDDEFDEDIEVYVYDKDKSWLADYDYSDSRNKITDYNEY